MINAYQAAEARSVIGTEQDAQARIATWWEGTGIEPHYPTDAETVAILLRNAGYNASPELLVKWVENKVLPPVGQSAGEFRWRGFDILSAAMACEARRRWLPLHPLHQFKLTAAELSEAASVESGNEGFSDLERYDVEALLGLLVASSRQASVVEVLAHALRRKLELEEVIDA